VDLAHPLDDGSAGVMVRSIDETARALGDGKRGLHAVSLRTLRWATAVGYAKRTDPSA